MAYLTYVQHNIEDGVVTDDFIVDKVYLIPNESGDDVHLMIKNYDIGDTHSGDFKLVGQKMKALAIILH
jgi:hypothetical protein